MKRAVKVVIGDVKREVKDLKRAAQLRERWRFGRAAQIRLSRRRKQMSCSLAVLDELMAERDVLA